MWAEKIYPKTYKGITRGGVGLTKVAVSCLEKNVNRRVYLCPEDSAQISSGPTFFRSNGGGGGSFTNPWEWQTSYLGTAVTKAARGERMGAFSARKVFLSSLPRRIYERKVVTKRRMGRWIRIRQWADFWASSWNTKGRWGISAKAPNNQPLPCATKQWLGQCSASPRCSTEHCYSLRPYPTSKNKRKESV